jgi:P-type conjugative transfer protein TrbJ
MSNNRLKPKRIIFAGAKIILAGSLVFSSEVKAFAYASEPTQIMNNVELIGIFENGAAQLSTLADMLDNEITQTMQQIMMVENQLRDLMSFGDVVMAPWSKVSGMLYKLQGLVSRGQALSYTLQNLDSEFMNRYRGFGNYATGGSYASQYKSWSQSSLDGIRAALQAQGLQAEDFESEQETMETLNNMSSSAEGTVRAVQAGNAIAAQQVAQLQKLRQLEMEQFNAYAGYMAGQQANQDAELEALQRFLNQGDGTVRKPRQSGFKGF